MKIDTNKLTYKHAWIASLILFLILGWTLSGTPMPVGRSVFCGVIGFGWAFMQVKSFKVLTEQGLWRLVEECLELKTDCDTLGQSITVLEEEVRNLTHRNKVLTAKQEDKS